MHPSLLGFKQSFGKFVAECKSPKPSSNLLRDLGKALFESSQEVEAFLVKTNESLARKRKENLETEARRSRLESELDVWVRHRTGRGILEFEEFLKCKDLRGAGVDPEVVRFQERVAYLENQVADLHSQLQQNLEMSVEELKGEEAVVGQVKSIMSKAGKVIFPNLFSWSFDSQSLTFGLAVSGTGRGDHDQAHPDQREPQEGEGGEG